MNTSWLYSCQLYHCDEVIVTAALSMFVADTVIPLTRRSCFFACHMMAGLFLLAAFFRDLWTNCHNIFGSGWVVIWVENHSTWDILHKKLQNCSSDVTGWIEINSCYCVATCFIDNETDFNATTLCTQFSTEKRGSSVDKSLDWMLSSECFSVFINYNWVSDQWLTVWINFLFESDAKAVKENCVPPDILTAIDGFT